MFIIKGKLGKIYLPDIKCNRFNDWWYFFQLHPYKRGLLRKRYYFWLNSIADAA